MHYCVLITVVLAACLAVSSSSPIDSSRRLVNRPAPGLDTRVKRSEHYVKGRPTSTKMRPVPALNLRKGEYMCGDKVCKLRPGDKPPCDHCQYPI